MIIVSASALCVRHDTEFKFALTTFKQRAELHCVTLRNLKNAFHHFILKF